MAFDRSVQLIKQGESVSPGTANRPLREFEQNISYIWDVVQAAALGSATFARRQSVEPDVVVGSPVWFNQVTQRFERAIAQVDPTVTQGVLRIADNSQVWGIVKTKINATLADILLAGMDSLDISAATGGSITAGIWYLSGSEPGKLVRQKPPVSVPVLRSDGLGKVLVIPQVTDFLDRHAHYRFPLVCRPAGNTTPPIPGDRHTIDTPDVDLAGWLPADHESFNGKAPAGAVFGYNLNAHTTLKNIWPPVPVSQVSLEWSTGLDSTVGFTGVPLGKDGLCVVDRHGIWWLSDCYGDVPWPTWYETGVSESFSDSTGPECPRHRSMEMLLWFTKFQFASDATIVRSLTSDDPRIVVECIDGTPASVGDLRLRLLLNQTVDNNVAGFLALKEFDPDTSVFKRGPMAEGIYSGSNNVTLTGSATTTRTISGQSKTVYHGLVGVVVDPADSREVDVQLIRLNSVEEQFYQDIMYLGFPAGQQSEIRVKINVPADLQIANPKLALRLRILGRAIGNLPQLTLTGRRVPRPVNGRVTPADLPLSGDEFAITCVTTATLTDTNQYVEAESTPFTVEAGDVVLFTLKRLSTDSYAGEVGLLHQAGIITAG